ncbi:hypothetical protein [Leisingera sp. JC1]|uniref:hypothetical protein n=1 Tax=Leisingera sp. JC1 TaxID=1855282 RepID=UPI0015864D96|nr:hypothetical protein [Leisingera sp. JC1]
MILFSNKSNDLLPAQNGQIAGQHQDVTQHASASVAKMCNLFDIFPTHPAAAESRLPRGLAQGRYAGQSCKRTAPGCGC